MYRIVQKPRRSEAFNFTCVFLSCVVINKAWLSAERFSFLQ